jgi:hypothetical protein
MKINDSFLSRELGTQVSKNLLYNGASWEKYGTLIYGNKNVPLVNIIDFLFRKLGAGVSKKLLRQTYYKPPCF